MRYLRTYSTMLEQQSNESLSYQEELQDFCESNLIYLIDEGYKVDVFSKSFVISGRAYTPYHIESKDSTYDICFCKPIIKFGEPNKLQVFEWSNIKDDFLTFIQRLTNFDPKLGIDKINIHTYDNIKEYNYDIFVDDYSENLDFINNKIEKLTNINHIKVIAKYETYKTI